MYYIIVDDIKKSNSSSINTVSNLFNRFKNNANTSTDAPKSESEPITIRIITKKQLIDDYSPM